MIDLDKKQAELAKGVECLNSKIDYEQKLTSQKIDCCCEKTDLRIQALRDETAAAIKLEAERRECGDQNLYSYVNATFVPGKLVMPLSSICPPAQPATTTTTVLCLLNFLYFRSKKITYGDCSLQKRGKNGG